MADRGDDGDGASRDGADEPFVAERQQILEAAAAARENDHVDAGFRSNRAERVDDRCRCAWSLHERLGDEQTGRREARRHGGDHVPLRGRVVSRDEADRSWDAGERPFTLDGEQALRGELPLQTLKRGQMVALAEAFDGERLEPELPVPAPELGATVDMDALPVLEPEVERVEGPTGHGRLDAVGPQDVAQREEHLLPAVLATKLGDLPLDPHRRQALEIAGNTAHECRHRIDGSVAVVDRFDLRHRAMVRAARRPIASEEYFRRQLGLTAGLNELDSLMEVGLRVGEALGERERVTGLDQHVQAPALDLQSFAEIGLDRLGHITHAFPVRADKDEPSRGKLETITEHLRTATCA